MTSNADNPAEQRIQQAIAAAWQRAQPEITARVAALAGSGTGFRHAAADEKARDEVRTEAISLAHRLAGSLGMYGFGEGTEIARELEQLWQSGTPDLDRADRLSQRLEHMLTAAAREGES